MIQNIKSGRLTYKKLILLFIDILVITVSSYGALLVRFDLIIDRILPTYWTSLNRYVLVNILLTVTIFYLFKLYHSLWNYASAVELQNILEASVLSTVMVWIGMSVFGLKVPGSYFINYGSLLFLMTLGSRFSYRLVRFYLHRLESRRSPRNIMVVGAGAAASIIMKEIQESVHITNSKVRCIIDDAKEKQGRFMHGAKVVGTREDIIECVKKYHIDEIIIAIPSASKKAISELVTICKKTKCEVRFLPGIYQLMNGEVSVHKLRKVDIEDLLGREPIKVDLDSIMGYVQGKVCLVTGGGGSIGSELCRQIAQHNPRQLIIIDNYENNAYEIQQELKRKHPGLNLVVLIATVRDLTCIKSIFRKYRPDIIYHAAAHKHVPLMEDSPMEAIKNNVLGTLNTVIAADLCGAKRFVMISTDKAVNPTNVMGASKRICEMIIQTYNKRSHTEYVAVRFGNVLGSNGSVIPLFRKQIESGGPVTVTHPDIIRFFMTIPEAVTLVLQAGAYAKGGEIFVLDMGEPVKIVDLARNLIRLSGFEPDVDIKIEYTGLRPGEKLYEEMLMAEEGMQKTDNDRIFIGNPLEIEDELFLSQIEALRVACTLDTTDIRKMIKDIVPSYIDHSEIPEALRLPERTNDVDVVTREVVERATQRRLRTPALEYGKTVV